MFCHFKTVRQNTDDSDYEKWSTDSYSYSSLSEEEEQEDLKRKQVKPMLLQKVEKFEKLVLPNAKPIKEDVQPLIDYSSKSDNEQIIHKEESKKTKSEKKQKIKKPRTKKKPKSEGEEKVTSSKNQEIVKEQEIKDAQVKEGEEIQVEDS